MSVVLLKDLPEEDYLRIKKLYIDSFPVDERMEFENLYGESPLGERKLLGIYYAGELAGFMALYNFEDWIYLLYFAIDPSLRGKGIGGQALAELNEMRGDKTITLDIERVPEGISDKGIRAERRTLQTIWAVSGKTAAELIYYRANADLPLMGLTSTAYPDKVLKSDIVIGKNYLSEEEINMLKLIVEQFLAFAEAQAAAHKPMYMKDWIDKLRLVLTMNEKSVLEDAGRISHQLALKKAEQEYNKYKMHDKDSANVVFAFSLAAL